MGYDVVKLFIKMEFLPSKEIAHADGLSRLIPKNTEPLEETVIASLKSEMDVKYVLFYTVKKNYQVR